ncbi:hypothetical protein Enr13x_22190 [Stieleria neptunia]|uniref:Uncharacterized protein n=1 Tax=Stieleria neptunia TaxID=2527979 RepID=A0A518HND5_9BACT|nr:hypothetical protein [Stieleria neptunia]QDV42374.1 hypothetical protein Enr13x_22190 [Stieleria neptunia]
MKCPSKLCLLAITLVSLTGCDPVPTEQHFSVPTGETLVAAPAAANHYRWPVIEDDWQATKPTDCAFLRQLEPGAIGEIADQIFKNNQKRIEEAKSSQQPPPWMVASSGLTGEALTMARLALDEVDGQPMLRESVAMPPDASNPTVWLDKTGRHLVIGGDNGLWISRLPWRPWWALPGTPPTDLDEPGDASKFQHLSLPMSGENAIHVEFFATQADGSDSRMIVAAGQQLHLVDCTTASVAATRSLNENIQHLSVAAETGHAAVVDQSGNLYLTDPKLATATKIGEVDVSLPMPAISPEAARIAAWHDQNTGRVFKLDRGALDDDFDVPLTDPGEPLMVRCSRAYDLWIEKNACHKRPNYPNTPGNDRQTWRTSIYWDIVDVLDLHNAPTPCTQLCLADRPLPDGGTERVMYDAILGDRGFGRPTPTKRFGDRKPVVAASGTVVALHDGQTIDLYTRIANIHQGVNYLGGLVGSWAWQNRFDDLEALHSVIRALPERRFNRTKEQIYQVLVEATAMQWIYREQSLQNDQATEADLEVTKERLAGFAEWADRQSPLALTTKIKYCIMKAWNARGNGWSSSVSEKDWRTFESQNKKAMESWKKLQQIDDVPAVAYEYFASLARDTSLSYDDSYDQIREFLERFPHDDMMHFQVMIWRLERWGGTRGSAAAYAAAVARALGPPMGDFIYSRCIERIANVFPRAFFGYALVDGNRVLAGVRQGLDMRYYREQSTPNAIILVAGSHSLPDTPGPNSTYTKNALRLCEDLAEYYRARYPMLPNEIVNRTGNQGLDRMKTYLPE